MLIYRNYKLRPIEEEDLEMVLNWRNSERIRMNMYTDHLITMEEHRAWFQRLKEDNRNLTFIFEYMDEPVGVMNFNRIDNHNRNCTWGFYLGKENLLKGTGLALGYLGLKYAFENLNIRKLSGEVFGFNIASYNFHKKLHFKEEGRLLKHIKKNGQYEDIILFAQFEEDWKKNRILIEADLQSKLSTI
ncbi:UDP-4-amino-4,6-dideoxy-N-acetyl-beta-L-altrosamine N-acetyltransferase [Tepidibacillus fermentans]|uniref:UDP-4-amino-4, 6-dideoxy-N-acetyl-beta-L-altrosamine N-acetyltransferase n=1 Tax=Tepidibacillus fermentans TaxID=1281767 RepID=A0A4R3KIE6_9BACI|nr:UDP-4-amino-4,6-dideoxy-N-acetyl-beta-L-altrosamine N-acetyltransferase [Tepidibacillus fermentans]TCS83308.1 UDP-4-amino-4,6-dideoxy-N-acetyl-beta-L-altrosamine N-acetyltransferase [Tepidibacillus fermentans]